MIICVTSCLSSPRLPDKEKKGKGKDEHAVHYAFKSLSITKMAKKIEKNKDNLDKSLNISIRKEWIVLTELFQKRVIQFIFDIIRDAFLTNRKQFPLRTE